MIHAALAGSLQIPELAITEDEGKALAGAIAELQQHYNAVLDPKTQAWVNLAIVAGTVYVPRVGMARMRMKHERQLAAERANAPLEERLSVPTQPAQNTAGFQANFDIPAPSA
jgi:uncharacterized protein (DUF2236 family)